METLLFSYIAHGVVCKQKKNYIYYKMPNLKAFNFGKQKNLKPFKEISVLKYLFSKKHQSQKSQNRKPRNSQSETSKFKSFFFICKILEAFMHKIIKL